MKGQTETRQNRPIQCLGILLQHQVGFNRVLTPIIFYANLTAIGFAAILFLTKVQLKKKQEVE